MPPPPKLTRTHKEVDVQSLGWYVNRLRTMSAAEIAWRARARVRQSSDRMLLSRRQEAPALAAIADMHAGFAPRGLIAADAGRGAGFGEEERQALLARADAVLENRVRLFDVEEQYLGTEIDWNYEYKAGKHAPMGFAPKVDYRDYSVTGDCKFVWELSRHHHLVILGRAYRATRDERYARAAIAQMQSWMTQCPYGRGMNWRSPLELGIRIINWACTLDLIRGSAAVTPEFLARLLPVVHLHLWEIARNYSRFSSANNHQIGEAAGVYVGSTFFASLKNAARWRAESRRLLVRAIEEQTFEDGGNKEQAFGYHLFVMQFFLFAGLCGRNNGDEFPKAYWERLEKMFAYAAAWIEGGDAAPMYGDADDGYVLDLGAGPADVRAMMAAGAVLFGRGDLKAAAGGLSEPAHWLFGKEGAERFEAISTADVPAEISSHAFCDTGYYLLQSGNRSSHDRISLTFDCGPLGYQSIAAHGHADALSVTLRVGGVDVLVDPGTYDYFTFGDWRGYFRGTAAHNTLTIDGQDQSELIGPFMWGRRAEAKCLRWETSENESVVVGAHDGYRRLADGVLHRRAIRFDKRRREFEIRDSIAGAGRHEAGLAFHFAEGCRIENVTAHQFLVHYERGRLEVQLDQRLSVTCFHGSMEPKMGWVSRGYHRKSASTTLVGRGVITDGQTLTTRLSVTAASSLGFAPSANVGNVVGSGAAGSLRRGDTDDARATPSAVTGLS